MNCFQPSFKFLEKPRNGSVVAQRYSPPATHCDPVTRHEAVSAEAKAALAERRATLDPVALLHAIRESQAALVSPELRPTPRGESLKRLLARMPDQWREELERTGREPGGVSPPTDLANAEGALRGDVVRRPGPVAGRSGRQRSSIAGPAAGGGTGPFQPSASAYVAAEGTAVARYHGRQAGLRSGRSNTAISRWNAGHGAGDGCNPSADFSVTSRNKATGRRD